MTTTTRSTSKHQTSRARSVGPGPNGRGEKKPADPVAKAEHDLAAARQALEEAVASGDVERVLNLRVFTEVEGPRVVTAAKVAKVDAEIRELVTALESGALQRADDEAEAAVEAVRAQSSELRSRLNELQLKFDQLHRASVEAHRARTGATNRLQTLRQERERLIERSEDEISASIRVLAGLPATDELAPSPRHVEALGPLGPRVKLPGAP